MTAVISECGLYRYRLERQVAPLLVTKPILFIGVNPSTADAYTDDATIRKEIGFTQRWGYSAFLKGNVFAYRSTDVKRLAEVEDPVGHDNFAHLRTMMDECAFIIPCWGNTNKVPRTLRVHFDVVRAMLLCCTKPIGIFGLTNSGDPLHPLMLPYSTRLQEWSKL